MNHNMDTQTQIDRLIELALERAEKAQALRRER